MASDDGQPAAAPVLVRHRHAQARPRRWASVSLPRFVAGPVSFGVNAGIAIVAGTLLDWQASALPIEALGAWTIGLALTAITLKVGWPILHTSAAGALLLAGAAAAGTSVWLAPLVGAAVAIAMARFASVGMASRWLSRLVGLLAVAVLGFAAYQASTGALSLGPEGAGTLELVAAAGALAVVGVLGLWHPSGDEDEA